MENKINQLDIESIHAAAIETIQEAKKLNVGICITLVDSGGHICFQIRMNEANFMANDSSFRKAKTSFLFRCPSHVLQQITSAVPILNHAIAQVPGDVFMLEGGLPIMSEGQCIGGVGIAGGDFSQDLALVQKFQDSYKKYIL